MKLLTLLILCCVAKDLNSASITVGNYMSNAQKQMNAAVEAQKKAAAAAGIVSNVKAPIIPAPANPNIVIVNPPKIPLPNPKCDFKKWSALLKALFGRVRGSCSSVKKSRGPLKQQIEGAKANFTAEFNVQLTSSVTAEIDYEFPNCSAIVNPAITKYSSCVSKVFDALTAATTGQDAKASGKNIDIALKELAIALKALFESTSSVTGGANAAAGTNQADAVATSDLLLSTSLQILLAILDLVSSVTSELSVPIGGITKSLSDAATAVIQKGDSGTKIVGSVTITFCATLSTTIKSVSSVDLDAFKAACEGIETDVGEATDSASNLEDVDDEEDEEETESPSEATTAAPSGESTTVAGETPEEKPTLEDVITKITLTITASFQTITKTCGAIKADVPAVGGKVDASVTSVSASLTALLTLVQNSATATDFSAQIDAAAAALLTSLTEFLATLTTTIDSLSTDTSVSSQTAVAALKLIQQTILSIVCKALTSVSVILETQNLFTTVTLEAIFEAIGKIDPKSADYKEVAKDLTTVTSPNELNSDSCKKVVEGLGKYATEAVGKIKIKFSARFGGRVTFIINSFGYTLKKLKVPKIIAGVTQLQGKLSILIKEIETAYACAKDSKASGEEDGSSSGGSSTGGSSTGGSSTGGSSTGGSSTGESETGGSSTGEPSTLEPSTGESSTEGSSGEDSGESSSKSEEGSGEKSKCKPVDSSSFKSVFEALLAILEATKATTSDTTLDPKALEIIQLIVKTLVTSVTEILTGLSTAATEQKIDVSVLLSLGVEILTTATSGAEIDYETLNPSIDGLISYGSAVDSATPALSAVTETETKISAPATEGGEAKDTKALLSELSTSATAALTVLTQSVSSLTKYFSVSVDGASEAITKISSIIAKFINGATSESDVTISLEEFLVQISSAIVEFTTAIGAISASAKTELDPKGYNALSALIYIYKSTTTIINAIFISFKVYIVDIPTDFTEFYAGLSDAIKADVDSPDAEPSELGGKVKESSDKYAAKSDSGSGSEGGESDENNTGENELDDADDED